MNQDIITNIGATIVWCVKYVFIPFGVAISARIVAEKLLQPHPKRQRKKRF